MDARLTLVFLFTVRELTTHPLTIDQIDQVFPLVQASLPRLQLEDWRAFGRDKIRASATGSEGIQSVVAEQNYIAGLCIYRIEAILSHGPALIADHFMALDLFDRPAVAHALAGFLEELGRRRGCTALHTNIAEGAERSQGASGSLASILRERGHIVESLLLCKTLDDAPVVKGRPRAISA
jgi:hypothetical protein